MSETLEVAQINIGYHPDGYRIDKTASAMNRYTKWQIQPNGKWTQPKPVCFDSLPDGGWYECEAFDWSQVNVI